MKLTLRTYDLHLKHTFTISRQSFDLKRTLIVELSDGEYSGFGESSENPYYHKTLEQISLDIQKNERLIRSMDGVEPEMFWEKLYPALKENMFALCALDMAYWDLYARRSGKKLFELWGGNTQNNPLSNFTLGIDSVDKMIYKMRETPWPIYKIKLGTPNDLEIVRELRKHSKSVFRIDANCAWTAEETLINARELKTLDVEFLEQPLPAEDLKGAQKVYAQSALPIIADESCQIEEDVETCSAFFHGVNIKLVKCGGLTPARRMIRKAKALGMKTMVGCMTESSIGISAIAHLLPELDFVDMDGALLLKEDIAEGVSMVKGKVIYSDRNGTGSRLKDLSPNTELNFS